MGFVIFFDSSLICVFAIFAIALGYQAVSILHGAFLIIAITAFVIQSVLGICYVRGMIKSRNSCQNDSVTSIDVFMTYIATAISLFSSYLYLADLSFGYGTGFWDLVAFAVALLACGVPWLYVLGCWTGAVCQEDRAGFNYWEFAKELFFFGIIVFLYFFL